MSQEKSRLNFNFTMSQLRKALGLECIIFDGTNYLVTCYLLLVFQDFRGAMPAIYGARLDKKNTGTLLDVQGRLIVLSSDTATNPSAAFDGENYLIVWEQWTDGQIGNADIWGALVDKDINEVGVEETKLMIWTQNLR